MTDLRVIGYTRVSTGDQHDNGHGLDAQAQALEQAQERRGWDLADIVRDTGSGKDLDRETLYEALQRLCDDEADALAVAKLDRLTRSLIDFAQLLEWFQAADKSLIALDFDLDTSTPTGELIAHIIMAVAQWERKAIGQRTSDALAAMRAQGLKTNEGNVSDDPELARLILSMRKDGKSQRWIADYLNSEGFPTIRGGLKWRQSAIQRVCGWKPPSKPRRLAQLPDPHTKKRAPKDPLSSSA